MRVLLTGSSGFIGNAIANAFAKENFELTLPVRDKTEVSLKPSKKTFHKKIKTIGPSTNWTKMLDGIDVVIHCAARAHHTRENKKNVEELYNNINVKGTVRLFRDSIKSGVKRFVFLSSVKAVSEITYPNNALSELSDCKPVDAYGRSKLKAEIQLKEMSDNNKTELIIIRMPLVYGPNVKGNMRSLIWLAQQRIPLLLPKVRNQRSLLGLPNLVDFMLHVTKHENVPPGTYFLSDGSDQSTQDIITAIRTASGIQNCQIFVKEALLQQAFRLFGFQTVYQKIFGNLQIDISKTLSQTDWSPKFSFEQQIIATLKCQDLLSSQKSEYKQ